MGQACRCVWRALVHAGPNPRLEPPQRREDGRSAHGTRGGLSKQLLTQEQRGAAASAIAGARIRPCARTQLCLPLPPPPPPATAGRSRQSCRWIFGVMEAVSRENALTVGLEPPITKQSKCAQSLKNLGMDFVEMDLKLKARDS